MPENVNDVSTGKGVKERCGYRRYKGAREGDRFSTRQGGTRVIRIQHLPGWHKSDADTAPARVAKSDADTAPAKVAQE